MKMRIALSCLLLMGIFQSSLMAWNKPGHMVTGAIAYQELASNPEVVAKVVSILKEHPSYSKKWKDSLENDPKVGTQNQDLYLFMYAARWPDDARNTPDHRREWHFIDFPFKPAGEPSWVQAKAPLEKNLIMAFYTNMYIFQHSTDPIAKAKALCWLFHLAGDVHQPLHTASLFTAEFEEGDEGGNKFFIRHDYESSTIKLHSYWDALILGSDRFTSVRNKATSLRKTSSLKRSKLAAILSEKNLEAWAQNESFEYAKKYAYLNGKLPPGTDEEDGEVLPYGYSNNAKSLAERQIVIAGYRLADLLKELVQP